MAINIKNLETRIQKKAASVTSNTPTAELGDIIEAANLATGGLAQYDSAGLLPTASSTQNIKIAYIKKDNSIRFNSGSAWNTMVPGASVGGAVSTGSSYTGRQGSNYGYTFAGRNPAAPGPTGAQYVIDKFSLSSDANATDVGDVAERTLAAAGHSSATDGYASTGQSSPATYNDTIQKYSFSSDGNATDIGYDMVNGRRYGTGTHSETHGYVAAGATATGPLGTEHVGTNDLEKFAFTNDANGTDVGDMTVSKVYRAGQNSTTDGYASGGVDAPGANLVNVIDKYPFASDANAADVGDVTGGRYGGSGTSSTTHGFTAGGITPPYTNIIDKFPFAADGNATDVGDLTNTKRFGAGQTSTTHAYMSGGGSPYVNVIQKWSTTSDENASDVGDLTVIRDLGAGAQY